MAVANEQHIKTDFVMTQTEADAVEVVRRYVFREDELENLEENPLADLKSDIDIFMSYYGERTTPPWPSRDADSVLAQTETSGDRSKGIECDYERVSSMLQDCIDTIQAMFDRAGFVCEKID